MSEQKVNVLIVDGKRDLQGAYTKARQIYKEEVEAPFKEEAEMLWPYVEAFVISLEPEIIAWAPRAGDGVFSRPLPPSLMNKMPYPTSSFIGAKLAKLYTTGGWCIYLDRIQWIRG